MTRRDRTTRTDFVATASGGRLSEPAELSPQVRADFERRYAVIQRREKELLNQIPDDASRFADELIREMAEMAPEDPRRRKQWFNWLRQQPTP